MKFRISLVIVVLLFLFALLSSFGSGSAIQHSTDVKKYIQISIDSILKQLEYSSRNLSENRKESLIPYYKTSRKYYKQIEAIVEYYSARNTKYFINGPVILRSEIETGSRIFEPHGFQVIEQILYSKDSIDTNRLLYEYKMLSEVFKLFRDKIEQIKFTDPKIVECVKFELYRIASLSLNGYDCSFSKDNILECAHSLQGCVKMLNLMDKSENQNDFNAFSQAINYCLNHSDYDSFDRLYFITRYMNPIHYSLNKWIIEKEIDYLPVNYALNLKSDQYTGVSTFNINYFSVSVTNSALHEAQAELGKLLFFDPILSGNNKRACASCHQPSRGFSDTKKVSFSFSKSKLKRNTPSLLNVVFQKEFFYDGRARQMEHQVSEVLLNHHEMNASIDEMILKLNSSQEYQNLFKKAFKGTEDTVIGFYSILKSISEYEKTLVSLNSRFDQYLKGDYSQLTEEEINGYNIFSGKGLCGTCHFFPLFNGLVPPVYTDTEYEVIGVPEFVKSSKVDSDSGRIRVSRAKIQLFAFKTPTIRNVELTAPYMHNGIYKTLDEVIDFYNHGGGKGIGIKLDYQTLPFDSLKLTNVEINALKAFLKCLTDTSGLTSTPKSLPLMKNTLFNKRKIGGEY